MKGDPFICPEPGVSGCLSDDAGVPQAQALAEAMKDERIDVAFTSPFGRALQTCEIVMEGHDVQIKILPFLYEWMPDQTLKELPSCEFEKINKMSEDAYAEETWKTDMGEGCYDMYARICPPFLKELATVGIHSRYGGFVPDSGSEDKVVAVFAHGGSLNVLLSFLLGMTPFPVGRFGFELTGVATLNFSEKGGVYYPQLLLRTL